MKRVAIIFVFLSFVYSTGNRQGRLEAFSTTDSISSFLCYQSGCDWIPVYYRHNPESIVYDLSSIGFSSDAEPLAFPSEIEEASFLVNSHPLSDKEPIGYGIIPTGSLTP